MVKEKPNSIRTYDEEGYRRRAACLCFKDETEQEVNVNIILGLPWGYKIYNVHQHLFSVHSLHNNGAVRLTGCVIAHSLVHLLLVQEVWGSTPLLSVPAVLPIVTLTGSLCAG